MASVLRFRKMCYIEPTLRNYLYSETPKDEKQSLDAQKGDKKQEKSHTIEDKNKKQRRSRRWRCVDSCCWFIGCMCTTWWLLLFLYHCLPSNLAGLKGPEPPGVKLKNEGLTPLHPVVLVPGIVTGGLELWEGKPCSDGLFRKRLWGGSFTEIFKRPLCWMEHLSLDSETGLDPPGIRVRPVPGLVAADYFAPGYFVWAVLIENLAKIGYEGKNMYMAAYDWRLSFQNTEVRDQALSRLKINIELMYITNGNKKVVVVPHSMGVIYFLHFLKWVEAPPPMGGGGGPGWCAKHIKAIMNIGPAFLGVPKTVSGLLSAECKDVAFIRAMAPGLLDSELWGLQTMEHMMRVSRTWDSLISLLPKGGDAIWGDLDSSPEDEHECDLGYPQTNSRENGSTNKDTTRPQIQMKQQTNFGRMIAFGKAASEQHSSKIPIISPKEFVHNSSVECGEVWTEYGKISRKSIQGVADNKAYTARNLMDLLRFVAPKTMKRAEAHFSHGIAEDLDDPKYAHYKYWSNPLETKLPNAPDMEIYCLYGVGIPTERSYVYKLSPSDKCNTIPFRIDTSADGNGNKRCLKGGVTFVDGDETVPVLSAGFMCAKGWRGKTRFNPSGSRTYMREYRHKPPASLLEGRGSESGAHVDIMGNVALIEDVLRVAAGASAAEIGGERIYSDILKMSERVNIKL
ncbi:putative phospholipid:diacylglycerol acyltransferase 2 [Rutidosis leptorrhynchoides]|uniref:putative phospholipid:diacylglycerol acyltransferase 2 n=1 Tax=Rutidosis leptorrhynchoides TaxID=125765 RepID=UPI003A98F65E